MVRGMVLDPSAARDDDIASTGPGLGEVSGKRIGFRVDRIWRSWDWISADWADRLRAAGADVTFWRSTDRSGAEGERAAKELGEWLATLDGAIVGLANCGSCTGWTIRDSLVAAATGIPTIAIATKNFEAFAHEIAARGGRSGLRVHALPYPLNEREQDEVLAVADEHYRPMLDAIGATQALQVAAQ
ncbi:MAG: hypothetical protein KGP14_14590 [Betaproteobacteria bacterium]|nr:hypothetical protein [Betaproteobacteria bacterium]